MWSLFMWAVTVAELVATSSVAWERVATMVDGVAVAVAVAGGNDDDDGGG